MARQRVHAETNNELSFEKHTQNTETHAPQFHPAKYKEFLGGGGPAPTEHSWGSKSKPKPTQIGQSQQKKQEEEHSWEPKRAVARKKETLKNITFS